MVQILERTAEYEVNIFHHFIDSKAAYGTINREKLIKAMKEFKLLQKFIGLVRATLKHVKCRLELQNNPREPAGTSMGLRQGDALSYILFNIALEKVARDLGTESKGFIIYKKTIQRLVYADDIALVGRSTSLLEEANINLSKVGKEMLFTINKQKSKCREYWKRPYNARILKVDDQKFERARKIKYIGSSPTEDYY
jgi:hypothetical protein